jgi:hypothetical protein
MDLTRLHQYPQSLKPILPVICNNSMADPQLQSLSPFDLCCWTTFVIQHEELIVSTPHCIQAHAFLEAAVHII